MGHTVDRKFLGNHSCSVCLCYAHLDEIVWSVAVLQLAKGASNRVDAVNLSGVRALRGMWKRGGRGGRVRLTSAALHSRAIATEGIPVEDGRQSIAHPTVRVLGRKLHVDKVRDSREALALPELLRSCVF